MLKTNSIIILITLICAATTILKSAILWLVVYVRELVLENQLQLFQLDGLYGVRALNEDIDGEKMILGSAELRFPFFDYINLVVLSYPLELRNIRGSVFADIGTAWDKNSEFRGVIDGKLNDIKFGYGFGPRINLGYFVLKSGYCLAN